MGLAGWVARSRWPGHRSVTVVAADRPARRCARSPGPTLWSTPTATAPPTRSPRSTSTSWSRCRRRWVLRHTFVTTMLDAGVSLRDVQIAARHADPRTTMRYDRARNNLDRHPNNILAAYMASGT